MRANDREWSAAHTRCTSTERKGFKLRSDVRSHKDRLQRAEWHGAGTTDCLYLLADTVYPWKQTFEFKAPSRQTLVSKLDEIRPTFIFQCSREVGRTERTLEVFSESSSMKDTRALQKLNATAAKCIPVFLCARDSTLTSVLKRFKISFTTVVISD